MLFAVFVGFDKYHFFALFPRFPCRIKALGVSIAALPCPADGQIFVGKSYKPKVNF